MGRYERTQDTFIVPDQSGSFGMKDSPQDWRRRAESFDKPLSYLVFARRMELSLRVALNVPTAGREGLGSAIVDLVSAPRKFEPVKRTVRTELAPAMESASLADCGAGTGSVLGFVEWAGLPYPKQLVLLEPSSAYYEFLQERIEGKVATNTRDRLSVIGREEHSRHYEVEHVVYVVQDAQTGQQSQIQLIHATAEEGNLPVAAKTSGIIFVGVSKYFSPSEFKQMVMSAHANFYGPDGGITAFNTQAKKDLLPSNISLIERMTYIGIKIINQALITGKPTLHNFYGREDIETFPGTPIIVHNGGDAIVVGLKQDH